MDTRPRKTDRRVMSPKERLDTYSEYNDQGCLIFTRGGSATKYPMIWVGKKKMTTSRAQWSVTYGEPSPDLVVRHKCDVRNCIELTHLEVGTYAENTADMLGRGRHGRPNAKIDQRIADEIRRLSQQGLNYRQLAERFGLHRVYVGKIVRRECYND